MMKLLLASENQGKLREIQALLESLSIELVTPYNLGIKLQILEDGTTYAENAARKALAYARRASLLSLADDSGLEVAILNGAPGLYSARFSPLPGASDADRRAYLLSQLKDQPRPWRARFHCTVALARPSGQVFFSQGECSGEIIPEERGEHGFGYDPIFYIPEMDKTMAELSLEEKNLISHRAKAIRAALPVLQSLLEQSL